MITFGLDSGEHEADVSFEVLPVGRVFHGRDFFFEQVQVGKDGVYPFRSCLDSEVEAGMVLEVTGISAAFPPRHATERRDGGEALRARAVGRRAGSCVVLPWHNSPE